MNDRRIIELITELRAAEQSPFPDAEARAIVLRAQIDSWLAGYADA